MMVTLSPQGQPERGCGGDDFQQDSLLGQQRDSHSKFVNGLLAILGKCLVISYLCNFIHLCETFYFLIETRYLQIHIDN